MQDQLQKLRGVLTNSFNDTRNRFGPSACAVLNSSITPAEKEVLLEDLQLETPATRIVYITPEQISSEVFKNNILQRVAANNTLLYVAIDEAHCISQWGHDFRPAYRRLQIFRNLCPNVPLLACTATSTPKVRDDVIKSL
ncbi:hypothetical protein Pmar_PMAR021677, partial [Perkinsus marinus ATCC 50983]